MKISFEGLNVSTRAAGAGGSGQQSRPILNKLKGRVETSKLTALMGGSGSGKTTLLSTLARRFEPSLSYQGSILYDNEEFDVKKHGRRSIAYVRQEDLVVEYLTVYEFLEYSGKLRLDLPLKEIHERIETIIKQLRLDKCRNTLLGGVSARGVSGGERKRAAIGNELLTQPKVLLTDEPTSGLDSTLSLVVVDILKELAAGGLTVLTTIHSPSSAIFDRFDTLMVLDQGEVFFAGHAKNLVSFLDSAFGLVVPAHFNPADFMMDVLILDQYVELKQRVRNDKPQQEMYAQSTLSNHCLGSDGVLAGDSNSSSIRSNNFVLSEDEDEDEDVEDAEQDNKDGGGVAARHQRGSGYALSPFSQTVLLFRRMWKLARTVIFSKEQIMAYVGLTLIAALLFFQKGYWSTDIDSRVALTFWVSGMEMYMAIFSTIGALHQDIPLVKKEVFDGSYSISSYFLAKQLEGWPNTAMWSVLSSIVVLGCTNLPPSVGDAVLIILVFQLTIILFQSLGMLISSAVPSSALMVVTVVIATFNFAFSGFFVPFVFMPAWYQWLRWPCLTTYSFQLILHIVFPESSEFSCDVGPGQQAPSAVYCTTPGQQVVTSQQILSQVGVDLSVGACVGTMLIASVVMRVVAFLVFQRKMRPARGLNSSRRGGCSKWRWWAAPVNKTEKNSGHRDDAVVSMLKEDSNTAHTPAMV